LTIHHLAQVDCSPEIFDELVNGTKLVEAWGSDILKISDRNEIEEN
jgi:hypothetical protein